jgi:hypothetical protein
MWGRCSSPKSLLEMLAALMVGCSGGAEHATLMVERPAETDKSCLGVDGFVVTIQELGKGRSTFTDVRPSPILSNQDCRLSQAFTQSNVDLAAAVQVSVEGYDAFRQLQVSGSTTLATLSDAPQVSLQLAEAWDGPRQVIVLGLADLTGMPERVTSFVLEKLVIGNDGGKGQKVTGVRIFEHAVGADERPFFVLEPRAFGIPSGLLTVSDPIRVVLTFEDGTSKTGDYALQAESEYLRATFTGRLP